MIAQLFLHHQFLLSTRTKQRREIHAATGAMCGIQLHMTTAGAINVCSGQIPQRAIVSLAFVVEGLGDFRRQILDPRDRAYLLQPTLHIQSFSARQLTGQNHGPAVEESLGLG